MRETNNADLLVMLSCVLPAAQAFCMDLEAQDCTLTQPADPVSYEPQTHLSIWARR